VLKPQRWAVMVRKGHDVKPSAPASGSHYLICPSCEAGKLSSGGQGAVQCSLCDYAPSRSVLEALRQIIALPDALGSHACEECGHPEMRRLPDGVSHCPGCGSEVLPTRSNSSTQAVSTSRGHRQGSGVGIPNTVPALEKSSQRKFLSASNRDCGDVANVRARGGFENVCRTH
jgi:ribosomal protein L37AE/L43A